MDISSHVATAEDIDALSQHQIDIFFDWQRSTTKAECDYTAAKITTKAATPTLVRGQASYTVAAHTHDPPKGIQFRDVPLDLEISRQARRPYRGFVPVCQSRSIVGGIYVYEMDFVAGAAFCRVRQQIFAPGREQRQTVKDFVRAVLMHIEFNSLLTVPIGSSPRHG